MKKLLGCVLLLVFLAGCGVHGEPAAASGFLLDTAVSVKIYRGPAGAAQEALALCGEYEKIFSRTDPDSELYRLNAREITEVSEELAALIQRGLEYGRATGGAFDITMGAVSALWDFTAQSPVLPDGVEVAEKLAAAGWEKVAVEGGRVTFQSPDTVLDLGGIAKGYIADRLAEYLRERGVSAAIIDLGGNSYCLGEKGAGMPFQIGVQYPYQDRNVGIGGLPVADRSVVTSGVYERGFSYGGSWYHHILDPETGWPVRNNLLAVTVVSEYSVDGDALSTACFVLGLEEGMALVEELEGVEAVFITDDFQLHSSSGLEGVFYTA